MTIKKPKFKLRTKKTSKLHRKMGEAPGTVTYTGHRECAESIVSVINYNDDEFKVKSPNTLEEISVLKNTKINSWIDVVGISDEAFIDNLGKIFGLNSLVLEDAVNTQQRPKIDEYDDYIFGVFKMLYLDENQEIVSEHLALVLLDSSVLVFQELKDDVFNGVRERIKSKSGRIRSRGTDYLFFALLDAVVDNYFVVLEHINNKIEVLEDEVYDNPTPDVAHRIQDLKKEVLMEMYMSNMSNKMNEVMKVLTIMASIFIPLTFIAGVYGMNFDNIPELHLKYGYPMVWGIMIVMFIAMVVYFKRKKWL